MDKNFLSAEQSKDYHKWLSIILLNNTSYKSVWHFRIRDKHFSVKKGDAIVNDIPTGTESDYINGIYRF